MGLFSESFYIFIFGAVGIISLLFIWLWKGNKFIGKRRSDKKTKGEKTALLREKDNRNIKAKDSVANVSKKKRLPFSKTAQTSTVHKFEHTHLLSSLKGHTGQLSGADLSSDGKMFISTADVEKDCSYGRSLNKSSGSDCKMSHSYEYHDANCLLREDQRSSTPSTSDTESSLTSGSSSDCKMSRRQKKNKRKKENKLNSPVNIPPLQKEIQYSSVFDRIKSLRINESDIHSLLLPYCLNVEERVLSGYPFATHQGVYVYKYFGFNKFGSVLGDRKLVDGELDKCKNLEEDNIYEDDYKNGYSNDNYDPNQVPTYPDISFGMQFQSKCNRCHQHFNSISNGLTLCFYHPRKAILSNQGNLIYTCCNMARSDSGCCVSYFHVFHHLSSGVNGPLSQYCCTTPSSRNPKIFGLDCEMVFTSLGFEVARATMVNYKGQVILDIFIQPLGNIFDYNTEFSGIRPEHLFNAVTFYEAQSLILQRLNSQDILIGHSLEGDLVVLKLIHRRVIDTSLLFGWNNSNNTIQLLGNSSPITQKRALKSLVKEYLSQDIQQSQLGHDSVEDAKAALNLVLNKINNKSWQSLSKQTSKIAPLPLALQAFVA